MNLVVFVIGIVWIVYVLFVVVEVVDVEFLVVFEWCVDLVVEVVEVCGWVI